MTPIRVQLSRKRGWKKPHNTVVVSRPSKFGNPFWKGYGCRLDAAWRYRVHVEIALLQLAWGIQCDEPNFERIARSLPELRGKNLACWCPADAPDSYCHAGVLLELANRPVV